MTTTKEISSPARHGGKECELEPEEREESCTTDCCTGNLARTSPRTHTVFIVECQDIATNSSCSASCGTGRLTVKTVKRKRGKDTQDCDICRDLETSTEEVNCNPQACPQGNRGGRRGL